MVSGISRFERLHHILGLVASRGRIATLRCASLAMTNDTSTMTQRNPAYCAENRNAAGVRPVLLLKRRVKYCGYSNPS